MARYRRRASRRSRRRPTGRIRRRTYNRRARYNRPDAGYFEKIVLNIPMNATSLGVGRSTNFQAFDVLWYPCTQTVTSIYNIVAAPNINEQWDQVTEMWTKYKPVGVKIEYKPPVASSIDINSISSASAMDYTITGPAYQNQLSYPLQNMYRALDFKQHSNRNGFKRYYHIKNNWKYTHSRGWYSTTEVLSNNPFTRIAISGSDMNDNDPIGSVTITYYYKFKDRLLT